MGLLESREGEKSALTSSFNQSAFSVVKMNLSVVPPSHIKGRIWYSGTGNL